MRPETPILCRQIFTLARQIAMEHGVSLRCLQAQDRRKEMMVVRRAIISRAYRAGFSICKIGWVLARSPKTIRALITPEDRRQRALSEQHSLPDLAHLPVYAPPCSVVRRYDPDQQRIPA